ncbi:MAG: response regulator [Caldilineaceae bacterium]|nr:response regulator [Caldilineaceae bacterium]
MDKVRILLADDHAVVRAGICNALQEMPDLEIVGEVGDGPSLMRAVKELAPDCLLIDVAMPDFQPVAAIHEIRARDAHIKILVVSAFDDDVYVQGLLGAGVNGYHLKDQPLSDLKLAVQRVLAGERWISSSLIDKLLKVSDPGEPALTLTGRQRDILRLLQQGYDNQRIAHEIGLSVKTIENHLTRIYRQLNVQSRLEAVHYVMEHPSLLQEPASRRVRPEQFQDAPTRNGPLEILLVDDNPRYRGQLRRMIDRVYAHATIHEAGDTGEALQLVENKHPQLALVDVILGDEDGIRCTRRLKHAAPAMRVILISAYPDREFRRMGLEAGAAVFVDKKDLDAKTMRQIIDDLPGN